MSVEEDRIAKTFQGLTVLITGGSGFLGQVLIEKLLRCTEVKRIYLLMRDKKGKSPDQRLHEMFDNVLYTRLKQEKPSSLNKCKIIAGDICQENLGISTVDRLLLQNEVELIYNSAASTRFDDSVQRAVRMNVKSTKYVLDLAQECKKLKAFTHISTSYAFPNEEILYEKAYAPPVNLHEVLAAVDTKSEEECEKYLDESSPNTYTFSKALAEAVVVERMDSIPCLIARPSIVFPIWLEPVPGWCKNLQGPPGMFVGAGKGIIRTMYLKDDNVADFIPVDIVINALLVGTWYFINVSNKQRVYNVTNSGQFKFTWEEMIETGRGIATKELPFNGVVWYPGGSTKRYKIVHQICFYLLQMLPALFLDALLIILGYGSILIPIQRRIQTGAGMFEYFTNREWKFNNEKSLEVRNMLNSLEKTKYKLDNLGANPREYITNCILAVRRHILNETDDMIPAAKRHLKVMWFVDFLCKTIFKLVLFYYIYKWILTPKNV